MKPIFRNYGLEQKMCGAIKKRLVVKLKYKDDLLERTFEPYILFEQPNTKTFSLCGYQTMNLNDRLAEPGWRDFDFYLVKYFTITDVVFKPDTEFSSFKDIYGSNVIGALDRP